MKELGGAGVTKGCRLSVSKTVLLKMDDIDGVGMLIRVKRGTGVGLRWRFSLCETARCRRDDACIHLLASSTRCRWTLSLNGTPTIAFGRLDFYADDVNGFGAYHDLYSSGTTVSRTEGPFRAAVTAHRFPRMLLFNRRVAGASHHRSEQRVRSDGFDHVNLQVVRSGTMAAGPPGSERAMNPGDVVVFDTARPQRTFVAEADYVSVAITRDAITMALPDVGRWHGIVLSGGAAGLLSDFLLSLGHRAASLSPALASESAGMTGQLLRGALDDLVPDVPTGCESSAMLDLLRWRAEAFIDANLGDRSLDADRVAAGIGTARSTLYRAFAPINGVMREILRRRLVRLSEALQRLHEARSIAALAFDFGFAGESHCNRAFKAKFGCPPGQYRAEVRRSRASASPVPKAGGWAAWWSDIS